MTWDTDRRQRLPSDWDSRRAAVSARAHGQCQAIMHDGTRCTARGTDCDHIRHGDNHEFSNLQWLCRWHHKQKTRQEALDELTSLQRRNAPRRPTHPGIINPR